MIMLHRGCSAMLCEGAASTSILLRCIAKSKYASFETYFLWAISLVVECQIQIGRLSLVPLRPLSTTSLGFVNVDHVRWRAPVFLWTTGELDLRL